MAFADLAGTGLVATGLVFLIGLFVGIIVKKALKLGLAILSLIILLSATGYITLNPQHVFQGVIQYAFSPGSTAAASQAAGLVSILPYASAAFLAGLAVGIWKG
jgi:uncharacterized membrane protein (Fun14 family)